MDKLKKVIDEHSRWKELHQYVDRIEGHIETDFSISVENAKSLLETIGKEICNQCGLPMDATSKIQVVLKNAFIALGFPNDAMVTQISTSFSTIGQKIGELRNDIRHTAHGKTLDEIRKRNDDIDYSTREFLVDSTVIVAVFLIRNFEKNQSVNSSPSTKTTDLEEVDYLDEEEFNQYLDDAFGDFEIGNYIFPSSRILYYVQLSAYLKERTAYLERIVDNSDAENMTE